MNNGVLGIDDPIMNIRPDQMSPEFQCYIIEAVSRGAQLCLKYFPEGPGQLTEDAVIQAIHRAGPEGGFKILIARDVPSEAWQRWEQLIRENYFRVKLEEPPKLEMRASSLYVYDDPSLLHRHIQQVITSQFLAQSVKSSSGVMSICNDIITRTNTDNSIDRVIPAIVMKDVKKNFMHGAIEIETRHRPPWASRQRMHEIFRCAEECLFVASLMIHKNEENDVLETTIALWTRGDRDEIRNETTRLNGFSTAPMYIELPIVKESNGADHEGQANFHIDLNQVAFHAHLTLRP